MSDTFTADTINWGKIHAIVSCGDAPKFYVSSQMGCM